MSLWAKAQQLPADTLQQIRAIYGEHFPIEVRHFLAPWIEEKFWSEIEPVPDNPQHEQYVATLIASLIQEMELKANSFSTEDLFLTKLKLVEAAKMFRTRYRFGKYYHNIFTVLKKLNSQSMFLLFFF